MIRSLILTALLALTAAPTFAETSPAQPETMEEISEQVHRDVAQIRCKLALLRLQVAALSAATNLETDVAGASLAADSACLD